MTLNCPIEALRDLIHSVPWWYWVLMIVYSVLECWLGRTKRTRANSVIDAIILIFGLLAVAIMSRFKKKENENGK